MLLPLISCLSSISGGGIFGLALLPFTLLYIWQLLTMQTGQLDTWSGLSPGNPLPSTIWCCVQLYTFLPSTSLHIPFPKKPLHFYYCFNLQFCPGHFVYYSLPPLHIFSLWGAERGNLHSVPWSFGPEKFKW